ncbi:MAG: hypothetical protein GY856_39895 [bacterium]|nr:hypothetical protein [bacterium]
MKIARISVILLIGLWVLVWSLRVAQFGATDEGESPARVYAARGYTETVRLFLRHGWLKYDRWQRAIQLDASFSEDSAPAHFYRESYLQRDVRAFNDGDRRIFRIENGLIVGIDPHLHNIVLPFSQIRRWHGTLTYRPEDLHRAELVGRDLRIELIGPIRSLVELGDRPLPEVKLASQRSRRRFRSESGQAVNIMSDNGVYFGKTHLVGDTIIFNHRSASPDAEISISGEAVPQGNRSRLDPGDLLKLQWQIPGRPKKYALLWNNVIGQAPVISSFRSVNGRWRRTPEKIDLRLAADMVLALDVAFQRQSAGGEPEIPKALSLDNLDLALTLDQTLQHRVQEILVHYCRRLRGRNEPPFRGAVTVMDTLTGEILALASYPTEKDLENWDDSTASRSRLLRNHNFARLPIGSVAKIIFAPAILEAAPQLAELKIPGYAGGKIDNLLAITLSSELKDHSVWGGNDQLIDFEEFIEYSSNRYAVTLLTLSGAADRETGRVMEPAGNLPDRLEPEQRIFLGRRRFDRRPYLRSLSLEADPDNRDRVRPSTLNTLEHEPHARKLEELFDVAISVKTPDEDENGPPRRALGEGDDLVDTSLWLPLLELLYGTEDIPRYHPFYGVSPERENLAYNLINQYRQQYLSTILGGASSVWTNPKVCEITSRLVTGGKIRRNLVHRIESGDGEIIEPGEDREVEPLGFTPALRHRLVNAMTRVASPNGTARTLNRLLLERNQELRRRGKVLGFFSKTGSPTNLSFVPNRAARALNKLIENQVLKLDAGGRIAYRDTGPVEGDEVEGEASPTLDALESNPEDMALLRRYRVSAKTVIRVCDTYNDATRDVREQLFEVRNGLLVRMKRFNQPVRSTGGAYTFTMGIYPAAAARARASRYLPEIDVVGHQPETALTVAIVIESQGTGPKVAVPLARELIEEVLWEALAGGW